VLTQRGIEARSGQRDGAPASARGASASKGLAFPEAEEQGVSQLVKPVDEPLLRAARSQWRATGQ